MGNVWRRANPVIYLFLFLSVFFPAGLLPDPFDSCKAYWQSSGFHDISCQPRQLHMPGSGELLVPVVRCFTYALPARPGLEMSLGQGKSMAKSGVDRRSLQSQMLERFINKPGILGLFLVTVMGRVKTAKIKRHTKELISEHVGMFTKSFSDNKRKVQEVAEIRSKKIRNIIAGYVTRLTKKAG